MKTFEILFVVLTISLFSCSSNSAVNESMSLDLEYMSFELESIQAPLKNSQSQMEQSSLPPSQAQLSSEERSDLGLPSVFLERTFLYNPTAYLNNLEGLVGKLVKEELEDGVKRYSTHLEYKTESSYIKSYIPLQGVLLEKKYNSDVSAGIKWLIADVSMDAQTAYHVIIQDVNEVSIEDRYIDKKRLYNQYNNNNEIDKYFIVTAATTTSIMYKEYKLIKSGTKFNVSAIQVGASYYSENSNLRQDWKIAIQLLPLQSVIDDYFYNN